MSKTRPSNREIIRKIEEWQKAGHVHPLTCGRDSSHPILKPKLRSKNNAVVLVCPECGYIQKHIPKAVLKGVPSPWRRLSSPAMPVETAKPKEKEEVTVTIYKSAWQALLRGERVAALRVFSEDELLHHQFGNDPGEFIVRVKITPVTD